MEDTDVVPQQPVVPADDYVGRKLQAKYNYPGSVQCSACQGYVRKGLDVCPFCRGALNGENTERRKVAR